MTIQSDPLSTQFHSSGPTVAELRHRAEIPMLVLAGLASVVGVVVAIAATVKGTPIPGWAEAALIGLVAPVFAGVVLIRFMYWKQIANSVEITPNQLPEIYAAYHAMATRMEIEHIPRLYLANGNGGLNAFASKCQVHRTYVVIFSDLIDIAYEHGDFDGVNFVLAHELGHVKCGHVNLWRMAIMAIPRLLFVGRSVVRAQEYTADRCAAYYSPAGARSLMVLMAGKRMYQHVDFDAYRDSIQDHKDGFWLKFVNFWSDHAVGFRRIEPLADIETTGWNVHGKML